MKKKIREDGTQSVALGTAIIVIVMIIFFGSVFGIMYSKNMLFLPSFIEDIFGLNKKSNEVPWDLDSLTEIIKSGKDENPETIVLDVSYDSLVKALLTEKEAEGLYLNSRITYYSDSAPVSHNVEFYRYGEQFRAEIYSKDNLGEPSTLKISDGNKLKFTDTVLNESVTIALAQDINGENEAGIPSVETVIDAVKVFPKNENISSQTSNKFDNVPLPEVLPDSDNSTAISNCTLKLVRLGNDNVYYVAFTNNDTMIREEYYILLEYRTIIFSTTKTLEGEYLYSYEVTKFSTDSKDYSDESLYSID